MELIRETSCFNDLRWRLYLDSNIDEERFMTILAKIGFEFSIHPLYPKMIEMKHKNGHSLVLVTATQRIQLRLNVNSKPSDRITMAENIAAQIQELL